MDVEGMLATVQHTQLIRFKNAGIVDRQKMISCEYAELLQKIGQLFSQLEQNEIENFTNYQAALKSFLSVALICKWGYQLLIDESVEQRLLKQNAQSSTDQIYLTMVELLSKSYQQKSQTAFVHAWHIFIKFGIANLKIDLKNILKSE
ncbi:MAG: hypothetical protein LKJ22_01125 [Liquorilactobacillus nagelii]|uniref:hypothetical protein n=1 Tax=Liquorilactobacillus nagelii TaxID=82688 RepID=UPI00243196F7|nr:hypothetical protein [Liquorilactobacillus nagelii]MCI1632391.1 hypothetical protein [Liquorilactobacillus nagelii]MCI1920506.1 hypothetical protein [Liquorilactobacillus nagelii]MCI1976149.1 hypothetical protein [Liquorilactobacillus nagelii]